MPKLPAHLRAFDDTKTTRGLIYDNALDSLSKRFPVEDDEYRLELGNVRYSGPKSFSMTQQKDALIKDRRLRTPVSGQWRLIHKPTNTVLDERDDIVMHVPYYTDRGTFIQGGNEYSIINQSRLKPGPYVRHMRTGDIETHFNVKPGTGKSFKLYLEPKTGVFKVNIGQSSIPLYPLLQAMGVSDDELIKSWGGELASTNAGARQAQALPKLYARLAGYAAEEGLDPAAQTKFIRESLPKFELDPDVVARTMGVQATGITPAVLLRATQKMLNVAHGEEDEDDRDAPHFSNVLAVEDFIKERIDKDAGKLTTSLLRRARRQRTLKPVIRGALNPYMTSLMLGSGLVQPLEETNPLHTLEQVNRITKLGLGGIGSAEEVTDAARDVNSGQFGFIDPITGPEDVKIGIDVRAAYRTFKGRDNQLYAEFRDARNGRKAYLTPADTVSKIVAFPGEMKKPGKMATAMVNAKVARVPKNKVDLVVPSFGHMMSPNTNLNPMPTAVQAGRQFYGSKFWTQYLPQAKGEVPLVDSLMPEGKDTFSEYYGRKVGALKAEQGGRVTRVSQKAVTVTDDNGKKHVYDMVKDFPFNRLTGISYFPSVKTGDIVNVGDMVAHSNFTDKASGSLNMGINLKTAVIPARGMSYEDAYVISASAARKLASERLFGFDREARHGVEINKNKFHALFPKIYGKEQLENIDKNGIIRPGTTVNKGDPLILAVGPRLLTSADAQLGKLHKVLRRAHVDKSQVWDHSQPGVVTDVAMTRSGAKVNVKTAPAVEPGDKLSSRFGLKGVVGKIIDDDKMPRDSVTNEPYELLLNPMTVLSRVAPNAIIEMKLAKIAKATGKQMRIPQLPPKEGWAQWTEDQLAAAGVSDTADIFDPESGKTIKKIGDGYAYISAFHHLAEKKLSSRGEQGGYTADEQPAKGGQTGSKKFSTMDVNAALAHGAPAVIRDVQLIRGTKNEPYWKALKLGRPLPEPGVPFIYDKFLNTLKAGGINISQKGDTLSLLPMIDKDVAQLSRGAVASSDMVDTKFEPIPNGLFDIGRTGGMGGSNWTHIELPEPLPNPVMEEPVRRLLGLTIEGMREIIAGQKELAGLTGGQALKTALANLDVDDMMAYHKKRAMTLRGANRDNSVKILGYLDAAKKQGLKPADWMITKVPVMPPVFRPVSRLGDMALEADMNVLYSDLIQSINTFGALRNELPDSVLGDERRTLYDAVAAAYGLGESITPEGRSQRLKGAIRQVIGTSPKTGLFQSKVVAKQVDVVGRGVVAPDPSLDMDSIGIPEDSAWTLYKDFVLRRLIRRGFPPTRAAELYDERKPEAKEMLLQEMQERPVIVDRAPTWHKFNLLAFMPHIVKDNTVRISPLVTNGFNMDFDGDQANFHVPVSEEAVSQAMRRMMPSRNLFSLTDLKSIRHSPTMEMTMGLYWLTQAAKRGKQVRTFKNHAEAKRAYKAGEIGVNDPITILDDG